MPSWNIHIAEAESLVADRDGRDLGIRDFNAFLFGNLVPDIYVGYMVPDATHTINYLDTHLTKTAPFPIPAHDAYWDRWVEPAISGGGVDDLTLGVWVHLLTDAVFNRRVRDLSGIGSIASPEARRIAKQSDFDMYGALLGIRSVPVPDAGLTRQAAAFCEYPVAEPDVAAACAAAGRVVADSAAKAARGPVAWNLLDEAFLDAAFEEVRDTAERRLAGYAARVRAAGFDFDGPAPVRVVERPGYSEGPCPAVLLAGDYQALSMERKLEREASRSY